MSPEPEQKAVAQAGDIKDVVNQLKKGQGESNSYYQAMNTNLISILNEMKALNARMTALEAATRTRSQNFAESTSRGKGKDGSERTGGGGDGYNRVPAGSPDGGQFAPKSLWERIISGG